MSRIGKQPVVVPQGVQVQINGKIVTAKGPQGELKETLPEPVSAKLENGIIKLSADVSTPQVRAVYGTSRARVANLVNGVDKGFAKVLDIVGLGFKAALAGDKLTLNIGKSHPVEWTAPKGVKLAVDPKTNQITVTGPSKELVGRAAAAIRELRPPEPYKATGIRYFGEHILRKAGKTAAGAGAGAGGAKK
ncbi:MAG: 50S ribosomal protein L6 [Elusimicrobia bacterium]|nr:50S ribosomal protein L6 [Elusimicrobiota bacterium]